MRTDLNKEVSDLRKQLESKENQIRQLQNVIQGLKRAYKDFAAIYNLSKIISSTPDVEKILELLVDTLQEVVQFLSCALLLRDPLGEDFYIKVGKNLSREVEVLIRRHQREGFYDWILRERRPVILPEKSGANGKTLSAILIPLTVGNKPLGMLEIYVSARAGDFTQREMDLLSLLANQAAIGIENANLYKAMELKTTALSSVKNYMSNILDSMADGIIAVDNERRVTLFNKRAEQMFGIPSARAVGNTLEGIFDQRVVRSLRGMIDNAFKGRLMGEMELEYPTPLRGNLPIGVRASLLRDEVDTIIGLILVCRDLSETKELLNLRRLDRLKDQFLASVSHELRTPVTTIKAFSEILLNYREDPETQKEFLTIINKESDRLVKLIEDLLDLAKIESGQAEWDIKQVNLPEVIQEAMERTMDSFREKRINISISVADGLPSILADRERLIQVFINLLSNAIKFTPEGGNVKIRGELLRGKRKGDASDFVKVAVSDTGIGIPQGDLKRIFDKFSQGGDGLTGKPSGTGLGLSITKRIIEHFGGDIWAESEVGKGSVFYFTIPTAR